VKVFQKVQTRRDNKNIECISLHIGISIDPTQGTTSDTGPFNVKHVIQMEVRDMSDRQTSHYGFGIHTYIPLLLYRFISIQGNR
jgi:hypothetical protein